MFRGLVNCNSLWILEAATATKSASSEKCKRGAIQAADVRLSDTTWDPVTAPKTRHGAGAGRHQWGKQAEE
jgi:hypothetical protein